MITYNEDRKIFKLDTPHTSYVMGIVDGRYLAHLYYGRKLGSDDLTYLMEDPSAAPAPSILPGEKAGFMETTPAEFGTSGTGDFRESAIAVTNADGQDACELFYKNYRLLQGKPALEGLPASFAAAPGSKAAPEDPLVMPEETIAQTHPVPSQESDGCVQTASEKPQTKRMTCGEMRSAGSGVETLEIDLEDPVTGLLVTLSYSTFRDVDVIARSVRVQNNGTSTLRLTRCLSMCMDMEDENFDMICLHGRWAGEHLIERRRIDYGGTLTESVRGIPGHDANPFYLLAAHNADQDHGNVYGFLFIYSGNFLGKVQKTQFGKIRAVLGIHPDKFTWELQPGATFQAPEVAVVFSGEGIGQLSRTYHDFIRTHLIRSPQQFTPRPVLINNWEATYFDFDEGKLLSIAREAKKAGIDMLVCDDGWFGAHRNEPAGCLGDWWENPGKFPNGFPSFVEKLHAMGLKAGLWFEPESISQDSTLFHEHPDWVLKTSGREPVQCRNQWILDLCNEEAVSYLIGAIESMIRRTGIDYIKWDMNRPLIDLGSAALPAAQQGEISHRHVLAVYRMQEQILQDFPQLLLENCAGGGSRFDAGMLYYSPQIWCSDDMDPACRLMIQEGTELVYPISAMGAHVGASPYGITGRTSDLDSRALCAMTGTFGYELDITKLPEEERARIPAQIARYKKLQPLIQQGDYYRLESYRENGWLDCIEIVSKDKAQAMILAVQVLARPNDRSHRLYLKGLDPHRSYEMDGRTYPGDILMQAGFLLQPARQDFYARIFEITAR